MINRRDLISGGAMATAAVFTAQAEAQGGPSGAREYYLLRRYKMNSGPQTGTAAKYFQDALLPALGRMGMGPVGVMNLSYGAGTPTAMLLVASTDLTKLVQLDLLLAKDTAFTQAAAAFWSPAATAPPFERVSSSVSIAFEGYPKLTVPAKGPRILQLRTYESPTQAAHLRKIEMFHNGEFKIFARTGSENVFFADDLIGNRGPSLTYMLAHKDLAAMDANWKAFLADPDWQKLSHEPRFSSEPIVSTVDNLVLTPTSYSQI